MHVSNIHIKIVTRFLLTIFLVFALQGLVAQNKEAIAKNGDGIYKMLKSNGLDPDKYTSSFIELNKKRLGKDNSLFIGTKYKLPVAEQIEKDSSAPVAAVPHGSCRGNNRAQKDREPLYGGD